MSLKAPDPILVTLSGTVTEVRLVHAENASFPMLVTLFGMVTEVRFVQHSNAQPPMLVTGFPSIVEGMFTEVSEPLYLLISTVPSLSISYS